MAFNRKIKEEKRIPEKCNAHCIIMNAQCRNVVACIARINMLLQYSPLPASCLFMVVDVKHRVIRRSAADVS